MGALRVLYLLDGIQKFENIDPKMVDYNGHWYVDKYEMIKNAELYAEGLKEVGARDVKIEWDLTDEQSSKSR